jgi:hypothetical protein
MKGGLIVSTLKIRVNDIVGGKHVARKIYIDP